MAVYAGDRLRFVREAVESILTQTYSPTDLYVFQDGPVSQEIHAFLRAIVADRGNCWVIENPKNRGLAVCLNALIDIVRDDYDYLARMDADDISEPDRIASQVLFMQQHPEIDVLGGGIVDIDESGREIKRVDYPITHEEILGLFRKRNPMAHVTVMFRKTYFQKAGLYPPVALEDALYWMQGMIAGCRFHNLSNHLVKVRRTDDFLMRRSGWRKGWQELRVKVLINRRLQLGVLSQLYAVAMFGVQISPLSVKKALYNSLR